MYNHAIENQQKSKINWLKDGDQCTKFFYSKMSSSRSRKALDGILNESGQPVSNSITIQNMAISYFTNLYNAVVVENNFENIVCKRILSDASRNFLELEINEEEIKSATLQINEDSSLGLDGMGSKFNKHHRDLIKNDLVAAVKGIFASGHVTKEINHTFITLVPKKVNATSMSDYHPISCCSAIYKIVSNVICNRIKEYLNGLTSTNQNAFITGRNISENSMLAYEMIRIFNRKGLNNMR